MGDKYSWADQYPWNLGRTWMGDALAIGTALIAVILLITWEPTVTATLSFERLFTAALNSIPTLSWKGTVSAVFTAQIILLVWYLAIEWHLRARERRWERRYRVWEAREAQKS